jgi:hypothetical protein
VYIGGICWVGEGGKYKLYICEICFKISYSLAVSR